METTKIVLDVVTPPQVGQGCPLDVMVPCNAFKCTPLRVQAFEA